ncbi:hypothetical protein MRX96_042683 [Rhipicephalus microplus]
MPLSSGGIHHLLGGNELVLRGLAEPSGFSQNPAVAPPRQFSVGPRATGSAASLQGRKECAFAQMMGITKSVFPCFTYNPHTVQAPSGRLHPEGTQ